MLYLQQLLVSEVTTDQPKNPVIISERTGCIKIKCLARYSLTKCKEKAGKLIPLNREMSRSIWSAHFTALQLYQQAAAEYFQRSRGSWANLLYKCCYQQLLLPKDAYSKISARGETSHFEVFNFRLKTDLKYCDQKRLVLMKLIFFSAEQPNAIFGRQAEWWCHTFHDASKECACKASLNLIVLSLQNVKLEAACAIHLQPLLSSEVLAWW